MKNPLRYMLPLLLCAAALAGCQAQQKEDPERATLHTASSYAMSTVITQRAYGSNGEAAINAVNARLLDLEQELSLFDADSYIAAINAAAGKEYVQVPREVFEILKTSVEFSQKSEGAFRVTIAPLTLAWGVTTDHPRVVPQQEIDTLLGLVDDSDILFDEQNSSVMLRRAGQAIDLGGIAKGWACSLTNEIYAEHGVENALLSIGGNIFARGSSPATGNPFKVGFRDPEKGEQSYMATLLLQDEVIAVSGGYERYFEQDGIKYQHIMDPATGAPAVSDVSSVGVISKDGAYADFMSTTLYVWGLEKTKEYMASAAADCQVILLDSETHTVYVSSSMKDSFALNPNNTTDYTVVYL